MPGRYNDVTFKNNKMISKYVRKKNHKTTRYRCCSYPIGNFQKMKRGMCCTYPAVYKRKNMKVFYYKCCKEMEDLFL